MPPCFVYLVIDWVDTLGNRETRERGNGDSSSAKSCRDLHQSLADASKYSSFFLSITPPFPVERPRSLERSTGFQGALSCPGQPIISDFGSFIRSY